METRRTTHVTSLPQTSSSNKQNDVLSSPSRWSLLASTWLRSLLASCCRGRCQLPPRPPSAPVDPGPGRSILQRGPRGPSPTCQGHRRTLFTLTVAKPYKLSPPPPLCVLLSAQLTLHSSAELSPAPARPPTLDQALPPSTRAHLRVAPSRGFLHHLRPDRPFLSPREQKVKPQGLLTAPRSQGKEVQQL